MDVIKILGAIYSLVWTVVVTVIVGMCGLLLVRFLLNTADVNPFSRPVMFVRRLTDPFLNPVRRTLAGFGVQPNVAPLVTILITVLVGYFALQFAASILNTTAGIILAVASRTARGAVAILGYALYGLLSVYGLFLVMRIIFSWGQVSYANRLMRFLVNVTDPLLTPLRRMIPPLGVFDLSAIFAFIIIWLFQAAIAFTLLRNLPLRFVD